MNGAILFLLNDMLKTCQVVFALNKRKIGKALGKKIKVSVVGIYNFEGAMEEKRNLDQLLAKNYSSGANCNYQT